VWFDQNELVGGDAWDATPSYFPTRLEAATKGGAWMAALGGRRERE
jgi:hypothetical protein